MRLSVLELPVSLAATRSGVPGVAEVAVDAVATSLNLSMNTA